MIYLNSFRPLCSTPVGRKAIKAYQLLPFIDGSIRREPDLESERPSISALCRFTKFAPRLDVGDIAVYLTCKARFSPKDDLHRRLVAILEVERRFETHEEAETVYRDAGFAVPANCMVATNPPADYDRSSRHEPDFAASHAAYAQRARECSVFLMCRPLFRELANPPVIHDSDLEIIFGRVPGTQNPPRITDEQYEKLLQLVQQ